MAVSYISKVSSQLKNQNPVVLQKNQRAKRNQDLQTIYQDGEFPFRRTKNQMYNTSPDDDSTVCLVRCWNEVDLLCDFGNRNLPV